MTDTPASRRSRERTLFFVAAAVFAVAALWLLASLPSLVTGETLVSLRGSAGAALIAVVACAVAVLAVWRSDLGRLGAERERLTAELARRDAIARQELQEARQEAKR